MTNLRKYGDLFIDCNFSIYAHTIFYEMINNQLIDHSDSLLITFRNIILDKFIKYIKLYFTLLMLKKEKIKLNQFKEFVFKS